MDKLFAAKQPYGNHAQFIEHQQRHPHEHLVHHIRCGGQYRGNDKINQNGIFSVLVKKLDIHDTDFSQKYHEDRHFKNHAKGDKQAQEERKILADCRHGSEKIRRIANQETKSRREHDKITKCRTPYETNGGQKGKWQQSLFFMLIKTRRDKSPDLPEYNRAGQQNAADQS